MHVLTLLLSALLIFITSLTIPTNVAAATCVTSPVDGGVVHVAATGMALCAPGHESGD